MKKILALGALALALVISGCGEKGAAATTSQPQAAVQNTTQAAANPAQTADTVLFGQLGNKDLVIKLAYHAATQSLRSMLPTELSFTDFNSTEKIAYPSSKLSVSGAPKGHALRLAICASMFRGVISVFSTTIINSAATLFILDM